MRLPSKTTSFIAVMGISALAALLPASWTGWIRRPFQVLGLGQRPLTATARGVAEWVRPSPEMAISPEDARRLEDENSSLRARAQDLQDQVDKLSQALAVATGLAGQAPDANVRLILAPVVAFDADPARDTLQVELNERTRPFVRVGQWVSAGICRTPSREMLTQQWLIGRVMEVQTTLARVQLVTDRKFRAAVQLATASDQGYQRLAQDACILDGLGSRTMIISQAPADYFEMGYRVVLAPIGRDLPVPMRLGRVSGSKRREDSSKHFDLRVEPWGSVEAVTHVFIVSTGSP